MGSKELWAFTGVLLLPRPVLLVLRESIFIDAEEVEPAVGIFDRGSVLMEEIEREDLLESLVWLLDMLGIREPLPGSREDDAWTIRGGV